MPFLPFEAIDSNGKTIRGTFQANSAQELDTILRQKGLRPISIGEQPSKSPKPVQAAPRPQPQPPRATASRELQPTQQRIASPTANSPTQTFKTPELTNKQKYFLFSQFSSFANSGFSANQMIHHASAKLPPKIKVHFEQMEQETAGGMTLSESMERRPMLFPPDQVAAVKAGEQSGHMEEAFRVVALQAERANAFRMTLGYFFIMTPLLILCGVGGIGLQKASASTIQKQFDADGQLDKWGALLGEIKTQLPHDFLLALVLAVGFIAFIIFFHKYPFRRFRHRMGLLLPIGHSRGRSEAVERFSWAMSSMLKGGASPSSAVHIAAANIPNLVLREQALNSIGTARENEPLGALLQRSGLLSPEYVHMVQNGELVGDTPGALNHIAKAEADTFQAKTGSLKIAVNILTIVAMALFAGIMVGFLYYMYASNMVKMLNNVQ